jgi:Cu+-exporting ATPase
VLNIVFTLVAAALFALTLRRGAHDPVCGMTVAPGKTLSLEHRGRRYFFCGPGCREKFEADPDRYAAREAAAAAGAPAAEHHHH